MADLNSRRFAEDYTADADHYLRDIEPSEDTDLPSYESLMDDHGMVKAQTIHIDGVLIFPSQPPARALYQLSRDLIAGTRISIDRIDHEIHSPSNSVPRSRIRDRLLYNFAHQMFDDSSIEFTGKRKECFTSILMVKTASFRRQTWTVCTGPNGGTSILDCRQIKNWLASRGDHTHEWRDSEGKLLAVEDRLSLDSGSKDILIANPSLRVVSSLKQKLFDVLVAAWCARIWNQNLKMTGQIKTIMKAKNAHFKH